MSARSAQEDELVVDAFAVVRAPLVSTSQFLELVAPGPESRTEDLRDEDLLRQRREIRLRLRALLERSVVREALYVASPSLHARIPKWLADPESKDGIKIEQSLMRYVGRMCTRCTPFGLFAGFGAATVESVTALEGLGGSHSQRRVRLDMGYLVALAEGLEDDAVLRDQLSFRPNASMYEVAGRLHVPVLARHTGVRSYGLIGVELDEPLKAVLASADGGKSRAQLAKVLVANDVSEMEARTYVDELVRSRILESNLEPPLTGDGALGAMLSELRTVAPQHRATISLGQVADALDGFAQQPLGAGVERYQQIESSLAGLPARSNHLFQVDLALGARASLGLDDVREIERGVHLLHALTPQHDALAVFRRAFVERYELREIPLALALDDEVGIGFVDEESYAREPAPLLQGLGLRAPKGEARASALPPTSALRDQLLLEKLEVAWRSGANVIDIRDDDLLRLDRASIPRLPDSLAALVSLHRLAGRMCVHLHHWAGPSAARLLGRFAAWDVGLAEAVRAHLRREEAFHPDAIYAELVHMPDASRAANVLLRPVLREHEIAFCGRSGVAAGGLVSVDDLTVSVAGDRIVLRSRRLQKEIRPRLASAHNFAGRQMTVYRFLASLQQQGVAGHGHFSWGSLAGARALPRVTSGRLILAPARFALSASEISTLAKASPLERMRYVAKLRTERGLPRYLGLEDGDNVLPVDLESSLTIDALVGACAGRGAATLIELFLEESTLVGSGEGGRYTCELVVPFTRATPAQKEASAPAPPPAPTIQRSYAPGSEWLYAKLYCARGSMDGILREVVHDFVRENADRFEHWFFLRYEDPHPHIRLRFHGEPQVLASELLPRLHRAIAQHLATGRIEKLEVSTYVRELERYGGDHTMSLVERIFCFDSAAAVGLALALEGETEGQSRWGYTLLGMHRLLEDFAFAPEVRTALVASIRAGFRAEMGGDEARDRELFERYRSSFRYVDSLLDGASIPVVVAQILERRSAQVRPLVQKLRGLRRAGLCSVTSEALAASLLHMWCNRMLRTDARAHELVLHTFLWRYYESLAARARRGSAGSA